MEVQFNDVFFFSVCADHFGVYSFSIIRGLASQKLRRSQFSRDKTKSASLTNKND